MIKTIMAMGKTVSQFTPTDIAGLRIWLKADSLSLNDNDPVATWTDSSGNGFNATASGTARPTYKTAIQNGKPILRFNGSTNHIDTGSGVVPAQPNTTFLVGKQSSKATHGRFLDGPAGGGNRQIVTFDTSGFYGIYAGITTIADSTDHSGAFRILTATFNGASSFGYINGTQVLTGNPGPNDSATIRIGYDGSAAFLTGDIAEILIYDTVLSGGNRGTVETYLNSRWAVF